MESGSKKRHSRFLLRICLGFGLLGLLLIVSWFGANFLATWDLDSVYENLLKDGYAIALSDLAPPPIPEEESSTKSYQKVLEPFEDLDVPEDLDLFGNPVDLDIATDWLKEHQSSMKAFLSIENPTKCRFGWEYEKGLFAIKVDVLTSAREASRALTLQAKIHSMNGNQEGARECLIRTHDMSRLFEKEPYIFAQLIRINIREMIFSAINDCVPSVPEQKELESWQNFIHSLTPIEGAVEFGFRGWVAIQAQLFQSLQEENSFTRENPDLAINGGVYDPILKWDAAYSLRTIRKVVELAKSPYYRIHQKLELLTEEVSELPRWKYPLTLMLFPNIHMALKMEALNKCRLLILKTGIRCELDRLEYGSYPEQINIIDPLTGKPLEYDREIGRIHTTHPTYITGRKSDSIAWKLRNFK